MVKCVIVVNCVSRCTRVVSSVNHNKKIYIYIHFGFAFAMLN